MGLENKVVVITGASSGIGEALAREFALRGTKLALLARRQERLDALATQLREQGVSVLALPCDVREASQVDEAYKRVLAEWGRVDGVVANAGFSVSGFIENLSAADFERQFDTNVLGVVNTLKPAYNELKRSHGWIAIVGSVCSYLSLPGVAPYCMSKHAVKSFAEALRIEMKSQGVGVTLVSPGFVASEIRLRDGKDPVPKWLILPADKAARAIVRGLERRKREIVVTRHAKVILALQRFTPWLVRKIVSGKLNPRKGVVRT